MHKLYLLFFICVVSISCNSEDIMETKLTEHLSTIEKEPDNCFARGQVARIYQEKMQFNDASYHFEKLLKICPDDYHSQFQYGITLLFSGKDDIALKNMYEAIDLAKQLGKTEHALVLEQELESWQKSKGKIKEMREAGQI